MDPIAALCPGDRLAGYRVVEKLGAGGMGTVYRAIDEASRDAVALKIVRVADALDEYRFEREAIALGRVSHPAVVRYLEHGCERGVHYLVMEWLEGRTLDEHLADVGLSPAESVAVAARVADGLAAIHALGLVHRDIKPHNLVFGGGVVEQVTILDFGVARPTLIREVITQTGRAVGTPGYMSPEQTRGERALDARSDVFSLGCVLYECLTGRPPFPGEHATAVCTKVLLQDPPPLTSLWPEAPAELAALIGACLSKEVRRRPADGSVLARQLAALPPIDPARPRRSRYRAPPTLPTTRLPEIASAPLFTIVLARPAATSAPAALYERARQLGASVDVFGDGTIVIELAGGAAVAHADALTALIPVLGPSIVAVATAPLGPGSRGDVLERVARIFEAEAIAAVVAANSPAPRGAVRADDATIALLAPPLQATRAPAAYLLP
jgi:serine/threonine protein kinase